MRTILLGGPLLHSHIDPDCYPPLSVQLGTSIGNLSDRSRWVGFAPVFLKQPQTAAECGLIYAIPHGCRPGFRVIVSGSEPNH